jgi:hypothetical protein
MIKSIKDYTLKKNVKEMFDKYKNISRKTEGVKGDIAKPTMKEGGMVAKKGQFVNKRTGKPVPAGTKYHMHPKKGPMMGAEHNPKIKGGTKGHDFFANAKAYGGMMKKMKKGGKNVKKVIEVLTPVPRKESGKYDDPYMKGNKKKSGEEKGAMAGFALGALTTGPLGALAGMLAGKYAGRAKEMNSIIKAAEKRAGKKLSPERKKFIKAFTIAERKGMDKFDFNGKEYSTKRKMMYGGMNKKMMKMGGKMKEMKMMYGGETKKPKMMDGGPIQTTTESPKGAGDVVATYQGNGQYKAGE